MQILALKAVEEPTFEDLFRRIQRWYSRRYHVDITKINTIPDEEIWRTWFEEQFLEWKSHDNALMREKYQEFKQSILFEKEYETFSAKVDAEEEAYLEQLRQEEQQKESQEASENNQTVKASDMLSMQAPTADDNIKLNDINDYFDLDTSEIDE